MRIWYDGGFAAFARGDMEALRSEFFAPDIRWHFPGQSALSGHHEGAAKVGEMFGLLAELSGGTERAGKQPEVNVIQVFHVRDGKVTEAWTAHADLYAFDEFWS